MSVEQGTRRVRVFDGTGNEAGEVELDEAVFGGPINQAVLHQALLRQQANQRQGTHQTKTRGEVSGGGKKPWRQKGTGRARQGSTRAPQWRHGGTVFGPHPRSYEQDLPKKQRRLALRSALASKADAEQVRVLEEIALESPKTKMMAQVFEKVASGSRTLFVIPEPDLNLEKSVRNLAAVKTILVSNLNVSDVMTADTVVFTRGALDQLGEWLS